MPLGNLFEEFVELKSVFCNSCMCYTYVRVSITYMSNNRVSSRAFYIYLTYTHSSKFPTTTNVSTKFNHQRLIFCALAIHVYTVYTHMCVIPQCSFFIFKSNSRSCHFQRSLLCFIATNKTTVVYKHTPFNTNQRTQFFVTQRSPRCRQCFS